VEPARHQLFDSILGGGSTERSDARIPPGTDLDVRRQAGVDEALGLSDRPFVELGDPGRERLYERIQIGVGFCAYGFSGERLGVIGSKLASPTGFEPVLPP
jgi:hypothetical protein